MNDEERKLLQKRIKHQRKELKRLNRDVRAFLILMRSQSLNQSHTRINAYRHAATLADTFLFGKRIAAAIRKWC